MDIINKIITEQINKTVLDNTIKKIESLMSSFEQIDFSPYGNEIVNFAQRVGQVSYYVIGTNKNSKRYIGSIKVNGKRGGFRFNPHGMSNTLRKLGIQVPNEGLTDNVYSNAARTYNWSQEKFGQNGDKEKQIEKNEISGQVEQIKRIMASMWPSIFSEYANLVSRYRYVLQKLPTLVSLVQTLDQLYDSVK